MNSNTLDFRELYRKARQDATPELLYKLGISKETAQKLGIGYIAEWKDPSKEGEETSARYIIPYSDSAYIALDATQKLESEKSKLDKLIIRVPNTGKSWAEWIYNRDAIKATEPVFITRGILNALAIIEAGGVAIATEDPRHATTIAREIRESGTAPAFLYDLGLTEMAQTFIKAGLKNTGIIAQPVNISGGWAGAFEYKQHTGLDFTDALIDLIRDTKELAEDLENAKAEELLAQNAQSAIDSLKKRYESGVKPVIVPTGFAGLDDLINGGFRAGLYILAISSLGKTSFIIQLADNIAKQGRTVLYISLEMAREELTAKILSRLTYTASKRKYGNFNRAKTTIGIQSTERYINYDLEERELLNGAIEELETRADKLVIIEGVGNVGVKEIARQVKAIKRLQGQAPVVIIDYLQILAPDDPRATDKQATDKAVLELKRLSRDENTPVICISSFNRDNYKEPVNLASFKESGAIEYTSDVLLGLQYKGMDYQKGENDKSKDRASRIAELIDSAIDAGRRGQAQHLELKVLKNRNGKRGRINLDFTPMFNYFEEPEDPEELTEWIYTTGKGRAGKK